MANLTTTAYYTRKAIKYGSITIVVLLVVRLVWTVASGYWQKIHPSPPPPPNTAFGKLPKLSFPQVENLPKFSYRLETIEGTAPKLDSVGRVYFIPKPTASLLALDRAKQLAKKMGFQKEPTKISERLFRFEGQNSATTLEIDSISQKFKLLYDFASDQSILAEKKLPNDEQAVSETKSFLRQADLLSDDLANGQAKVSYLRFIVPDLIPAISLSEADFVRVDLFPQNLDNLSILPPNPKQAQVSLIFSGNRDLGKRIIQVNYAHSPVNREKFATYALKDSNVAWQELASGKGYVAAAGENSEGEVVIRKISLAYFESENSQDFLQPIFVFEGDNNFVAYLSAIDPQWTE